MKVLLIVLNFIALGALAQNSYADSLQQYQQKYVQTHEVVKGNDRNQIHFYPVNKNYRVLAHFERKENSPWFTMNSSGPVKKIYRVYGTADFTLSGKKHLLNIYQSQSLMESAEYKDYLFIPFTDSGSGNESYIGGRYLDIHLSDIKNGLVFIDFNKAYNPYCAYVSGRFSCPIPPKENNLSVVIKAGEKAFKGAH